MRANYWLLVPLLFLLGLRRVAHLTILKAFFPSRETQLVLFELFVLFVGLTTS